ncbi:hypothetical protein [Saccharothrix sp. ALI-22-I]|uniref:hypothetical protein n=1 Tax=Saccharothrix sp. ALI-22-I TaxID=1933778 RepID=UPI001179A0A3|nr:hypothetical protein [Saccharothrix sp. ALI-22-I]
MTKALKTATDRLSRTATGSDTSGATPTTSVDESLRAIVRSTLSVVFRPDEPIPKANVSDEITTLTTIRWQTPDGLPVRIERRRISPLHPGDSGPNYLASAVRSGLLAIHPDSPLSAFDWTMPADPDTDPVLDDTYRPALARHYTPWGRDEIDAVEAVDRHLTRRLDPDSLDRYRSDELVELARELLVEETVRYLRQQLHVQGLPDLRDQESTQIRHVLRRLLGQRRLGEAICLAWRAVRMATEPPNRAADPNGTTSALSWFIRQAEDYIALPERHMKCFTYFGTGCAAMTWTLLREVLDLDPLTASVESVQQLLPHATRASDAHTVAGAEFPVLRCGPCGLPLLASDAWLCLDILPLWTALKIHSGTTTRTSTGWSERRGCSHILSAPPISPRPTTSRCPRATADSSPPPPN